MKKIYLVTTIIALTLIVGACGQSDDNKNVDNNNDVTTNDEGQNNTDTPNNDGNITDNDMTDNTDQTEDPAANTDDKVQKMESLAYIDFELDVKYDNDQDYEVDLELDNNRVEAKLEDDLNGTEIEGDGAFDEIYPLVEQLTIDENTAKEDVITQVIDVFDLPSDYNEFELEITFKDGTKKEYDDRK